VILTTKDPDNPVYGFAVYALLFVESEIERASVLYLRALAYGIKALGTTVCCCRIGRAALRP